MPPPDVIFIWSDNIVEVTAVTNVSTGTFINNADVTLTLVDAESGSEIVGQTWPLQLSYVTSSDGNYRGTLQSDLALQNNQCLLAQVTVDGGVGLKRYWEKSCVARVGD